MFGQPLPDALKNPPELMEGLEFFLNAFYELTTCRSMGMGLGPIPWTSIANYASMWCESEDFAKDLHFHIRALDARYLTWANKNTKENPK